MTSTVTFCISLKKTKQLDLDEIIEILDQAKAWDPEWHEAMTFLKCLMRSPCLFQVFRELEEG
jgi:hypothetical protein